MIKKRVYKTTTSYQVIVAPFRAMSVPTKKAAEALEVDLKLRKTLGHLYQEKPTTLGQEIDERLRRREVVGGRNGPLAARTLEMDEREAKAWGPLRTMLVPELRRRHVEDHIVSRAARAPVAAAGELEFVKATLTEARSRGQRIDPAIFEIPPISSRPREGKALTIDEIRMLASWFDTSTRRLVELAGFVGARQHFWFALTDEMVDVKAGTMDSPAWLSKNRRAHRVFLSETERKLFAEQLVVRPKGTALVFPTPTGRRWERHGFRRRAWLPAVAAAQTEWREKHDTRPVEEQKRSPMLTPFDDFTFHMLRHSAGSLMALAGLDPAVASERMGHTDGGALFLGLYRHIYEGEKRENARKLDAMQRLERSETEVEEA